MEAEQRLALSPPRCPGRRRIHGGDPPDLGVQLGDRPAPVRQVEFESSHVLRGYGATGVVPPEPAATLAPPGPETLKWTSRARQE